MSQAYVLLAHGSRRHQSNLEVMALASALGAQLQAPVMAAFIEQTSPTLAEASAALVNQGANAITIIPYLLAAGRHLAEDIPALVADCQRLWPQLSYRTTNHAGGAPLMVQLLADLASGPGLADT